MLRINHVSNPGQAPTLKLEGKLLGPWVNELRDSCRPDCIVFSGDATALGYPSELARTASVLGVGNPAMPEGFAVTGNHDYYTHAAADSGAFESAFGFWEKGERVDGRDLDTIRPIVIETGVLPRTHGSSMFQRGETQALVSVTLGTADDEQRIDSIDVAGETTLLFRPPRGALGVSEPGIDVSRFALAREVRPGKVTLETAA